MDIAVITPWFEHLELCDDYFRAIENGPPPAELIIVDNGSAPPLEFATIRNEENFGFCKASNQGLEAATVEAVAFINNDIALTMPGWLDWLADTVESSVLAGARLRTDSHAMVDGVVYPYLDGWCLAGLREDLLELGGFDESLEEPAYYSDNLLCLEARARGFTLREAPVGLRHRVGATAGRHNRLNEAASRANHQRYQERVRALVTKGALAP